MTDCCRLGKTGPSCRKKYKYYRDDACIHPDYPVEDESDRFIPYKGKKYPICGHLEC